MYTNLWFRDCKRRKGGINLYGQSMDTVKSPYIY